MKRSEVVIALANVASQGKYTVDPAGSRKMNAVFDAVAKLINDLEAEENALTEVPRYVDNEPKSTTAETPSSYKDKLVKVEDSNDDS